MSKTEVLLSRLASEQLADLSPTVGRAMVKALTRLTVFPESAPPILLEGYESYRQVLVKGYRAICGAAESGGGNGETDEEVVWRSNRQ